MLKELKSYAARNSGKVAVGAGAIASTVSSASAMSASDISNGTALLNAGISVAATEPLGSIISMIAVIIGAIGFIKIVRRLY